MVHLKQNYPFLENALKDSKFTSYKSGANLKVNDDSTDSVSVLTAEG